jgi:threonine dehydrogenase-like Zn-dependent dehydrogenase
MSIVGEASSVRVPASIEPRDAVFFGLVEIAMTAIRRAPVELGQRVLVSGLGLVGILVGELYQISGASVTAADLSRGRLNRGAALGFDPVIDLCGTSLVEWYEAHPDSLPDLSIEAAGIESNIDACLKVTKPGGRVVLQGSPRKTMEIDPYTDIHRKGLTIIGAHVNTVSADVRKRDAPYLFTLCEGPLHIADIRTHEMSFRDAPTLYDRLEDSLDEYLAVVLTY